MRWGLVEVELGVEVEVAREPDCELLLELEVDGAAACGLIILNSTSNNSSNNGLTLPGILNVNLSLPGKYAITGSCGGTGNGKRLQTQTVLCGRPERSKVTQVQFVVSSWRTASQ